MLLTGKHRVVQIHPTLRCNLRCLHCYSDSGPHRWETLPLQVAAEAVRDAAVEGYEALAVSGGEPLLYEGLVELLGTARAAGLVTAVTTNGTLSSRSRLEPLRDRLDLLAISLDGVPASHDRMRQSASAFERLKRHLPTVRASGIRFGFLFTLTQFNVHELEWVTQFAAEQGAALLQIHPLELAGRARKGLPDEHPDEIELGFGLAEAVRLRLVYANQMVVHIDVATSAGLRSIPELPTVPPSHLSEVVSPLVIEVDGTVVPLTHGFSRDLRIGNLHDRPLRELAAEWLEQGLPAYAGRMSRLLDDQEPTGSRLPVMNPYELAVAVARA